ncbi:MAG: DNA phosphorothioation-associated putative methyltransferase [Jaaginema sp. PMC 1079.18]|nr:DNA phosphorothioation-associated putative methyltransferase [Jaaginema sp. PMC 1080.18]MEC4850924.1 DNA phosphorothioation-associated putative methyltransferase [Jaaginema sp. PMC 1079.18]MEC4864508.1 DNA phosphorothioation-associated putative methyltransferase [Jaaginema sp. PMC 1078.18]
MTVESPGLAEIASKCEASAIGKLLPGALYVHVSALSALDPVLQAYEQKARQGTPQIQGATLVKFSRDRALLSYLFYPDFDTNPHPPLEASIIVNPETLEVQYRNYRDSDNPPILHRKETFVTSDYPHYQQFAELTYREERLGLLDNPRFMGTQREWQQRLEDFGVAIQGHKVVEKGEKVISELPFPAIERHKAALVRKSLSRPVRAALGANLFEPETTFFDYGCGYGGDVERIAAEGYICGGWDPYYQPDTPKQEADIVNLGYIINVIENTAERREALLEAWGLTRRVLIVAAQVLISDRTYYQIAYGDGVITRRNTFQKYYEQEELKGYIDQVLQVNSVPVELGIYFVFRDEIEAEAFRASRFHSRAKTPRIRVPTRRFADYEEMLVPLLDFVTERGRLPVKGELATEALILEEFRSYRSAWQLVLQATDALEWEAIAEKRRQELKLYLALAHFSKRPKVRELSPKIREDIKALFGSYKQACLLADMMLFSMGDLENLADLCWHSSVGLKRRNAFIIHISALEELDPLLRLYEGCASRTIGRFEEANVIKFHLKQPSISYLYYPEFDAEPHPALQISMRIYLQDLNNVVYQEYPPDNSPLLHHKDALVLPDYPDYEKFARLTIQEQDRGLLQDYSKMRDRRSWLKLLAEQGCEIRNYRLFWHKDIDPYQLKILKAAANRRASQRRKREKELSDRVPEKQFVSLEPEAINSADFPQENGDESLF